MVFSRQENWSGLAFPSPGHLPDPGIEPVSLELTALAGGFFTTNATWTHPNLPSKLFLHIWIMAEQHRRHPQRHHLSHLTERETEAKDAELVTGNPGTQILVFSGKTENQFFATGHTSDDQSVPPQSEQIPPRGKHLVRFGHSCFVCCQHCIWHIKKWSINMYWVGQGLNISGTASSLPGCSLSYKWLLSHHLQPTPSSPIQHGILRNYYVSNKFCFILNFPLLHSTSSS